MKPSYLVVIILMGIACFSSLSHLSGETLELVGMIEDNDENALSRVIDASLTECKDIIVLDMAGHSVSRYKWDGTFVNKIGGQGAGPGDFSYPQALCIHTDHIYIHDFMNYRVVKTDAQLKRPKYFPLPKNRLHNSFLVPAKNTFMFGSGKPADVKAAKIYTIGEAGKIIHSFFHHTPVDVNRIAPKELGRFAAQIIPRFGLDRQQEKMLIAFSSNDNPIRFYLYDLQGKCLNTFEYKMEKEFQYPDYLYDGRRASFSKFKGKHISSLYKIFHVKGNWYVFFRVNHYPDGDYELTVKNSTQYKKSRSFYLKFSNEGKFLQRVELKPSFQCFYISEDGYVLGTLYDTEIENVTIYKIVEG